MRYYMSVSMGVDVMAHRARIAAACTHLPNHLVQLLPNYLVQLLLTPLLIPTPATSLAHAMTHVPGRA